MKSIITLSFVFLLSVSTSLFAQDENASTKSLPNVELKSMDGKSVMSSEFENDGKPIIISFWATWCKPCILELTNIAEDYEDLQDETGVKLIAISIDDARNSAKVKPAVNARGWEYEVYIDENGDFRRAMGVNNVPHTFVLDGKKNITWDHASYSQGDEEELYEIVHDLVSSKK